MLPITTDALRLFLHVLAATVWVGGQIVLAGLVPVVRRSGQEALTATARRFRLIAWPAWGVLGATGLWNLDAVDFSRQPDQWRVTVMAKIGAFVAAGALTAVHTAAGSRHRQALAGATASLALLASLAALLWGVTLRA